MVNIVSHKKKVFYNLFHFSFYKQTLRQEKIESPILKSITYHLLTKQNRSKRRTQARLFETIYFNDYPSKCFLLEKSIKQDVLSAFN